MELKLILQILISLLSHLISRFNILVMLLSKFGEGLHVRVSKGVHWIYFHTKGQLRALKYGNGI